MSLPKFADHAGVARRSKAAVLRGVFLSSLLASIAILPSPASTAVPQLGLPTRAVAADPRNAAITSLGKRLFVDKRLSADGTISCSSCHVPQKAFSDGLPVARGIGGSLGTRNTPSLWNVAFTTSQFWDGRRVSLEEQAADPLLNPREHGLPDSRALLAILRQDDGYQKDFQQAFNVGTEGITLDRVVTALAAFERTLVAGDSPFDRYVYGHNRLALSDAAIRGLELFRSRAQCATCHVVGEKFALLTDNLFHTVGVGLRGVELQLAKSATQVVNTPSAGLDRLIGEDPNVAALGRFVVTQQPRDIGKFKTPGLRNVALTAPYMHDGTVATLAEAIDVEVYYRGLETNAPLILTPQEKRDLLAFLDSVTSHEVGAQPPAPQVTALRSR